MVPIGRRPIMRFRGTKRRATPLSPKAAPDSRGTAVADVSSARLSADRRDGSLASAAIILPLLIDIFRPRSLIDVGCGQGTWSKTATSLGPDDQVAHTC